MIKMNWYKQIKLAAPPPIVERDRSGKEYIDIAHDTNDFTKNYLWFIDTNYQFYMIDELETRLGTHGTWPLYNKCYDGVLAKGRYDKKAGVASFFILSRYSETLSQFRLRYMEKRIESILDKQLNNPEIIHFD